MKRHYPKCETVNGPSNVADCSESSMAIIRRKEYPQNYVGYNDHGPMWSSSLASAKRIPVVEVQSIINRMADSGQHAWGEIHPQSTQPSHAATQRCSPYPSALNRAGRMDSVKWFRRDTAWRKFCRWLGGDWWLLETDNHGAWGVWHPWRHHRWENYVFTKAEAEKEAERLNSGRHYEICKDCGTTFASHHNGTMGGLRCPTMLRHNDQGDSRRSGSPNREDG